MTKYTFAAYTYAGKLVELSFPAQTFEEARQAAKTILCNSTSREHIDIDEGMYLNGVEDYDGTEEED